MTRENPLAIVLSSSADAQIDYDDRDILQERGKPVTRLRQLGHKRLYPKDKVNIAAQLLLMRKDSA